MASVRHPNVISYLGVCPEPACIVTEYCSKGSLTDVLRRCAHPPPAVTTASSISGRRTRLPGLMTGAPRPPRAQSWPAAGHAAMLFTCRLGMEQSQLNTAQTQFALIALIRPTWSKHILRPLIVAWFLRARACAPPPPPFKHTHTRAHIQDDRGSMGPYGKVKMKRGGGGTWQGPPEQRACSRPGLAAAAQHGHGRGQGHAAPAPVRPAHHPPGPEVAQSAGRQALEAQGAARRCPWLTLQRPPPVLPWQHAASAALRQHAAHSCTLVAFVACPPVNAPGLHCSPVERMSWTCAQGRSVWVWGGSGVRLQPEPGDGGVGGAQQHGGQQPQVPPCARTSTPHLVVAATACDRFKL